MKSMVGNGSCQNTQENAVNTFRLFRLLLALQPSPFLWTAGKRLLQPSLIINKAFLALSTMLLLPCIRDLCLSEI